MFQRLISLVLLAAVACLLNGCGGGRSPQVTARSFFELMAEGKLAEAKKFATEDTGKFLDFAASMGSIPKEPNFKFQFVSEKIEGDTAVVRFKDKDGTEEDIDLIKVDGEWKVHIKKE